ncbi:MAG: hypothetical protein M3Y57_18260 [Acidobacteriota bacterium]|nr:hypothetical protein [Acidobacteriota bacterium]
MRTQQIMNARLLILSTFMALLIAADGCSRLRVHEPTAKDVVPTDNSYMDLQPGWRLRIVVPLLKSGGFRVAETAQTNDGNAISVSSRDLIGYDTSYYTVKDKGDSGVRLEFASAAVTRDGKTVLEAKSPSLPFELPRRTGHLRLIYLVRVSQADHNMAIVASKRLDSLNAFTARLKESPSICRTADGIFCSWVPAGVAVRPEKQ